jgi:hypothetical protein
MKESICEVLRSARNVLKTSWTARQLANWRAVLASCKSLAHEHFLDYSPARQLFENEYCPGDFEKCRYPGVIAAHGRSFYQLPRRQKTLQLEWKYGTMRLA